MGLSRPRVFSTVNGEHQPDPEHSPLLSQFLKIRAPKFGNKGTVRAESTLAC